MESNNKRVARNTVVLYVRMLFSLLVSLYTSRVVLNTLGIVDYGILNVVGGVVAMFGFLNGSMAGATARFLTIELGTQRFTQYQKVFSVTLVNHFCLAVSVVFLAETIGLWFVQNKLVIPIERKDIAFWVYQLSVISCFISIIQIPYSASIIAHEAMDVYAYGGILEVVLRLLVVMVLGIVSCDKLVFWAIAIFSISTLMTALYYFYVTKVFSYCRFSFQPEKAIYKKTLLYSGWDLLGCFSTVAQGQGLNMLINMFFGPVVNAARGIAYQVEGSVTQFGSNFMMAVRPQIYKYYAKGEVEKMMDLVYRSARYSFFLLWILSLPILIESDYILTLWLKNVPEYTTVFARIVLIISLISALRNPFIAAMHATGKIKLANLICGSLLIMTLPISYLYLRLGFGPSSVFLVSLLITFVNMWVELMLVKRVVHFSIKEVILKVLLVSLLVALVSCLIPWSIQYRLAPGFYRFFLVGLASVLSVFAAVYLIGIDAKERVFIGNRIKSFMPL